MVVRCCLLFVLVGACSDGKTTLDGGADASTDGFIPNDASSNDAPMDAADGGANEGGGTLEAGMLCVQSGDCASGLSCASLSNDAGVCERVCSGDQDCVSPGGLCETVDAQMLCSPNCDPKTRTGCGAGLACRIAHETSGAMRYYTTCGVVGTGGQGAQCTVDSDCQSGESCVVVNQSHQCVHYCNVQAPTCPGSTSCTAFSPTITIGTTTYGACF